MLRLFFLCKVALVFGGVGGPSVLSARWAVGNSGRMAAALGRWGWLPIACGLRSGAGRWRRFRGFAISHFPGFSSAFCRYSCLSIFFLFYLLRPVAWPGRWTFESCPITGQLERSCLATEPTTVQKKKKKPLAKTACKICLQQPRWLLSAALSRQQPIAAVPGRRTKRWRGARRLGKGENVPVAEGLAQAWPGLDALAVSGIGEAPRCPRAELRGQWRCGGARMGMPASRRRRECNRGQPTSCQGGRSAVGSCTRRTMQALWPATVLVSLSVRGR